MDFRVLSYNIHRAIGVDRLFRPERIASIIRYYEPDVVLLQEVDDGVPRSKGLNLASELAARLGFEHYRLGANVSLRKGTYGNATLCRFPIVRERNIDLSIGARKRRGCQHTTLAIDDGSDPPRTLEVFNLHLGLSAREREQQAGILVRSQEFPAVAEDLHASSPATSTTGARACARSSPRCSASPAPARASAAPSCR